MRSISLLKVVPLAALGCMVLVGCGAPSATAGRTATGSTAPAATPPRNPPSDNAAELRFVAMGTRITQDCAPDSPGGCDNGGVPGPEDLPGREDTPAPRYGPGETPPGTPNAEGDIPVPAGDAVPTKAVPDPAGSGPAEEVPLTGVEKCSGSEHAQRVGEAFRSPRTTSYQVLHRKLTELDYPASRIHRMQDRSGAPLARLDLRLMGSHVALEVTGTSSGAIVEAFGAPETEDVSVADVMRRRKPTPDAPTS
ncbi:hypothetical protein [Streptomyces sp. NRRL S-118]|uniref:hypothetical protein n=1 Tax=Streptomyces sp. NRRL S-118 TaxID=1463881 RepID=UPI0004C5C16C|nr:hypothetical protein [Streptomyces sp. NRRL S-118]